MIYPQQNPFTRLVNAWRVGWRAAQAAWNPRDFVPESEFGWDDYEARLARYATNRFYVHNTIYTDLNNSLASFRKSQNLYKLIRGLRNPVSRLVKTERDKVWGGFINYETFEDGALPLKGADERLTDAIRTIWQWSNMDAMKGLLVYDGSSMGDVAIKVIDDLAREKVYLEVLDPRKVREVKFDNLGNVKEILIAYQRYDTAKNTWYEYGEHITKERFTTYYNQEPYAYVNDESGMKVSSWPNPYGFVPVEWVKHQNVGQLFGATSYHDTRTKIDNLNDLVSLIHDSVRIAVKPPLTLTGKNPRRNASGGLEAMNLSTDARDQTPLLYLGEDGQLKSVGTELDVQGAMLAVTAMLEEIEDDLPILALKKIRKSAADMSGTAIENLYGDAVDSVSTLQSTYLSSLKSSSQMAISIGAFRRYPPFRGYNLNSFESGALDFDIRPKPLFQDNLSKEKKVTLALQAVDSAGSSVILKELGYDKEDVQEIENAKSAKVKRDTKTNLQGQANQLRQNAAIQRLQETPQQVAANQAEIVSQ